MRLISLKLKNYRQFKDAEIEFPDGVTGIIGLNGAGKSTIIEAISWTLYGNVAARTDKQGIKRAGAAPSASVEVMLVAEISGIQYQITRVLKGQSQMGSGQIVSGGKVIAESVKGMDKEIEHLIGMDFPSFKTSFLAKQKELNALTDLKPAERKDVIIRMLGINSIDKAISEIRKDIRENKQSTEFKKRSLKDGNELRSEAQKLKNDSVKTARKVTEIEEELKKLKEVVGAFADKFNEDRKLNEKYNKLKTRKAQVEATLTEMNKREKEHIKQVEQLEKLEKELPALSKAYEGYEALKDKSRKFSATIEKQIDQISEKLEDMGVKYRELSENEARLKAQKTCPTCGQEIINPEKINEHFAERKAKLKSEETRLTKQKAILEKWEKAGEMPTKEDIADFKFDAEELEVNEKEIARLKPLADRYPLVKARVDQIKEMEISIEAGKKEKVEFENDLNKIIIELEKVPFDPKKYDLIALEFNKSNKLLESKYEERNSLKEMLGRIEGELIAKEKEIINTDQALKDIENSLHLQEDRNRLADIMTEYRTFLISRIQPELAEISGRLFSELTNGKYQGVELDENYEMHIYDGGAKYPLSRFSGGEADLANLCLRLAISQLISSSTGAETGFIILDEIFGSQDQFRKSAIMEALSGLSKMFRQMILITHVDEIKDGLEHIIEVSEDDSGISSVKQ